MKLKAPKFIKRNKSNIMFYGGIGLILAGTVGACVASFKAKEVLEELEEDIDDLHEKKEEMDESEYNQRIFYTYGKACVKVGSYFIAPVASLVTGVVLVSKDRTTTKDDLKATSLALAANIKDFKDYRKNVIADKGEEADKRYRFNIRDEEIEEIAEDGTIVNKTVPVVGDIDHSIYSRFFDSSCEAWKDDPEENMSYLIISQQVLTDKLRRDGFLFLNDVYEQLGIPKTPTGQVVGWCMGMGDDYVDFGLYNVYREGKVDAAKARFINGYESCILLDFNVDGPILDEFQKYATDRLPKISRR